MKILVSSLILFFSYNLASACVCINTNSSDVQARNYLKSVKAIFYGEVVSISEKSTIDNNSNKNIDFWDGYHTVKFKVFRAWKGIDNSEVNVEADLESSCNCHLEVGSKVTVYAFENKELNIPFMMNYCSINHFDDEKMKREYGEGKVFEQFTQLTSQLSAAPNENSQGFWSSIWKKITSFFS
jgi:hypothetical protein